jgi:predicted enzyme related to lactoylglutathione lyase
MLQVRDVGAARRWYEATLGLRSGHGGDEFEMLLDDDRDVLHLHRLDAAEHGIEQASGESPGAGTSFWFELANQDAVTTAVERARAAGGTVVQEPHWNPQAHHHEATLTDVDGYVVAVHSPFEAG